MTQGQSQVNLLTIQRFADICATTPKALRLYERKGILKPFKIDRTNKYRSYLPDQARNLMQIKLLQNFGFSLTEIKTLFRKHNISEVLDQKIKAKQQEILEEQRENNFLLYIKKFLLESPDFSQIIETEIGPFKMITKQIDNGQYSKIAEYLTNFRKIVNDLGLKTGTDEFTFYLDHNYNPQHSKLEVAFKVEDTQLPHNLQLPEGINIKDFPLSQVKIFKYKGPYEYLNLVYQKLIQDYQLLNSKKPFFDIYKNTSKETSRYDLLTKTVFPQS